MGLSLGRWSILGASCRNQLLLAPLMTSAGGWYQLSGSGFRAVSMNLFQAGAATKTASDWQLHIVSFLPRVPPSQITVARSGVQPTVRASWKSSVVPVLAAL